ncbi:MAG: (Fe-S)-binding protein [Deltaproteobacteria bacterium]|nr:(Fe-S)-binding protein [Deltaproteobacteria bacterium]MBW2308197.1 (Fe-S)-binding protein [Deltaproteobacteria bacterium]
MKRKKVKIGDISKDTEKLAELNPAEYIKLPPPFDNPEPAPVPELTEEQKKKFDASLDGYLALGLTRPQSKEEEEEMVKKFISGLKKLMSEDDNWTFLQPLMLSIEYCARCQTCSEACPVFTASGREEIYRPTYRAEVLRRLYHQYIKPGGKLLGKLKGGIELNWTTISRLAELAYRCTLCRRCASVCPIGVDNGLIAHEIRKLFSQELGIAPKDLHEQGTVQHLRIGSSTGMTPVALKDNIEFMEEEVEERTGMKFNWPVDKEGADILLIHNAGEFLAWPENPEAFAIILEAAGISYTLSSDLLGYDAVNYGLWYDDIQLARVAHKHVEAAKKLKVNKIVLGECGHSHKALAVVADRVFSGGDLVPRESCLTLLEDIVKNGKLKLDPQRNDFPVTLHDPCNIVRSMGIVKPQREILRIIAPKFREMEPHGVDNYCCGGGSGFAIMQSMNFPDWRSSIAGRMKLKQILDAFEDELDPSIHKYLCAPCSNCKGQIRDLFNYYNVWEKAGILYGGLVELIVNAMTDIEEPFIKWEWM